MQEKKLFQERQRKSAHAFLLYALLFAAPAFATEKISLYYNERVPYLETQANGDVAGLTATPGKRAFQRAGVDFEWKKAPADVQLATIKENQKKACLVGWFKNPDREKLGKFTHPFFTGHQIVAVGLADNARLGKPQTVKDLLQNKQAALLIKDGYSYGRTLDQLIQQANPLVGVAKGENINMLHMLAYKRADYFFIAEDEVYELIRRSDYKQKDFSVIRFSDTFNEDLRYLWCTNQVPDEVIVRLNAEIDRAKLKN